MNTPTPPTVEQLVEALYVRKSSRGCKLCGAYIEDGFSHEPSCVHFQVEEYVYEHAKGNKESNTGVLGDSKGVKPGTLSS